MSDEKLTVQQLLDSIPTEVTSSSGQKLRVGHVHTWLDRVPSLSHTDNNNRLITTITLDGDYIPATIHRALATSAAAQPPIVPGPNASHPSLASQEKDFKITIIRIPDSKIAIAAGEIPRDSFEWTGDAIHVAHSRHHHHHKAGAAATSEQDLIQLNAWRGPDWSEDIVATTQGGNEESHVKYIVVVEIKDEDANTVLKFRSPVEAVKVVY
ncbi:hypothetical protein C8Q75DRAFT_788532 [Abortiporus biennis]|nr:hypothetical protein C8Q75DRAFT_788532 [Abortiporus biennis]